MSEHALILYNAARHALAEARKVDEVMAIRDQAERLRLYTRQAKDRNLLADATEIHIRATRRLGELLVKANEAGQISVGRPKKNGSFEEPFPRVRLQDAGISKKLSHESQKVASISEQAFEAMVDRTRGKITTGRAAVINPMKEVSTADKKERRAQREQDLATRQLALPDKKFGVILEDFEWDEEVYSRESGMDRHASNHYPTAHDAHTPEEIVERTRERFLCAAPDCVLFMWVTVQHLWIGMQVLALRGFEYRSHFAWGKDKIGMGRWNRNKHEILLVGVTGTIPAPAPGTQFESLLLGPRGAHSKKPDWQYELIERHYPNLPKIELNARRARAGWDCWGLDAPVPSITSSDHAPLLPPPHRAAIKGRSPLNRKRGKNVL